MSEDLVRLATDARDASGRVRPRGPLGRVLFAAYPAVALVADLLPIGSRFRLGGHYIGGTGVVGAQKTGTAR
jgi:hypothetical protein